MNRAFLVELVGVSAPVVKGTGHEDGFSGMLPVEWKGRGLVICACEVGTRKDRAQMGYKRESECDE
jgi:hypothetical protein